MLNLNVSSEEFTNARNFIENSIRYIPPYKTGPLDSHLELLRLLGKSLNTERDLLSTLYIGDLSESLVIRWYQHSIVPHLELPSPMVLLSRWTLLLEDFHLIQDPRYNDLPDGCPSALQLHALLSPPSVYEDNIVILIGRTNISQARKVRTFSNRFNLSDRELLNVHVDVAMLFHCTSFCSNTLSRPDANDPAFLVLRSMCPNDSWRFDRHMYVSTQREPIVNSSISDVASQMLCIDKVWSLHFTSTNS